MLALVATAEAQVVDLRPATAPGACRQARVLVEAEGKLKLNADGKQVSHLPLKVNAELLYHERVISQSQQWTQARLLRSYQQAEARLRLKETDIVNRLRDDRRLIALSAQPDEAVLFSPTGPLTREELELLQVPASSVALEALLPGRPAKVESQWTLPDATVARLLGLDLVSQQKLTCTLQQMKDHVAIIGLEGTVAGAVDGVSSDIELKGKLNFDLRQKAVTWLTLAMHENRAIGHAQPGFEISLVLRMVAAPSAVPADLSPQAIAGLTLEPKAGQTLLELPLPAAGIELTHDRRWRVMTEEHDATVLRLVDRGDLVAQCNLSPRPALAAGEQLSLEGFQDDVRRALGKNAEQMVEASEEVNDAGLRILRVLVAGKTGELPIQWTYYHVSNDAGRRAALVFTMEGSLSERYPQIDRELVAGFRFAAEKSPTPAAARPAPPGAPAKSAALPSGGLLR